MRVRVFRDESAMCQRCGKRYVFRIEKQRALAQQGREVEPEGLCSRCRRGERVVHAGSSRPRATVCGNRGDPPSTNGNCRVYVGRLSYDTGEEVLLRLFEDVGTVHSVQVIRDRHTGLSRGFAFVEMATTAGAQQAIHTLNGAGLNGRQIKVAEARPRRAASPGTTGLAGW